MDQHILSICTKSRGAFSDRHDNGTRKMEKLLAEKGYSVKRGKIWIVDREKLKPDIVAVKNRKAYVLDLTIPYEKSSQYMDERKTEKEGKYEKIKR